MGCGSSAQTKVLPESPTAKPVAPVVSATTNAAPPAAPQKTAAAAVPLTPAPDPQPPVPADEPEQPAATPSMALPAISANKSSVTPLPQISPRKQSQTSAPTTAAPAAVATAPALSLPPLSSSSPLKSPGKSGYQPGSKRSEPEQLWAAKKLQGAFRRKFFVKGSQKRVQPMNLSLNLNKVMDIAMHAVFEGEKRISEENAVVVHLHDIVNRKKILRIGGRADGEGNIENGLLLGRDLLLLQIDDLKLAAINMKEHVASLIYPTPSCRNHIEKLYTYIHSKKIGLPSKLPPENAEFSSDCVITIGEELFTFFEIAQVLEPSDAEGGVRGLGLLPQQEELIKSVFAQGQVTARRALFTLQAGKTRGNMHLMKLELETDGGGYSELNEQFFLPYVPGYTARTNDSIQFPDAG